MGFLTETQVIASAKKLMQKDDGAFVRTNGLWHALMFLRFCACRGGVKQYEFQAHDLAQAAFDLNGIELPVASGARNVYFEAGATQGKEAANFFRHHDGPRQTYLNRIYTGLAGAGPKQPKIFDVSGNYLPVKINLTKDWVENLRSSGDNRFILDERIHDLITWIFRFGIPLNGQNTAHFATHAGNGNLNLDTNVSATALPSTLDKLEKSLSDYLSLSPTQLKTLMPELKNVRLDTWTGQTPIDIGSFGARLFSELSGVITAQVKNGDFANITHHFIDSVGSSKLM